MPGPGMPQPNASSLHNPNVAGFQTSNITSHYFLGAQHRPWMTDSQDVYFPRDLRRPNPQSPKTTGRHRPRASLSASKTGPPTVPAGGGNKASVINTPQTPLSIPSFQSNNPTTASAIAGIREKEGAATEGDQNTADAHATRNTPQSSATQMLSPSDIPQNLRSPESSHAATSMNQHEKASHLAYHDASVVTMGSNNYALNNSDGGRHIVQSSPATTSPGVSLDAAIRSQTFSSGARGTKRPSDAEVEESSRNANSKRKSNSGMIIPSQLPTPHDSPTTLNTDTLSGQLETAFEALKGRSRTIDLTPVVDEFRMKLLRDACQLNDMFFLATHWILSVWSRSHHIPLLKLQLGPKHVEGLQILGQILGSSRQMTKELLDLCVNFPSPMGSFLASASPNDANRLIESAKTFLYCLAMNFTEITTIFLDRGWPPCPIELRYALQLPSVVLQKVLFVSLMRGRYADQPAWIDRASWLFDQALDDPAQNAPSAAELLATGGRAVAPIAHAFGSQYCKLKGQNAAEAHAHSRRISGQLHAAQTQGHPQMYQSATQQVMVRENVHGRGLICQSFPTTPAYQTLPNFPAPSHHNGPGRATAVAPQPPPHHRPPLAGHHHVLPAPGVPPSSPAPQRPSPIATHTQRPPSVSVGHVEARSVTQQAAPPGPPSTPLALIQQPGQPQLTQPLIPREPNFVLPLLAVPDSDRRALHQAHLRSPFYEKVGGHDGKPSPGKWYQFVEDLISLPQLLDAKSGMVRWKVEISSNLWMRKAEILEPSGEFLTARRKVSNMSTQFRLKSVGADKEAPPLKMTPPEFSVQSAKWPRCLSVSINGDAWVDFQRKAHHGADLPTDVTEHLKEGTNEVVVCVDFTPREAGTVYSMAIEVVCVADRNTVLSMLNYISVEESLSSITAALKNTNDGTDDEEVIVSQAIVSIDIVDPFMSTMWVTPVRGLNCHHRECFDLDAFLDSRVDTDGLTSPDQWKCPICQKDARPPVLVLDKFLFGVRQELARTNKLDTKAILIKEDGTWIPKPDEPVGKSHGREKDETETPEPLARSVLALNPQATASLPQSTTSTPQPDEVIILDDD